jgi:3-oxoadipate enol-lactonase
VINPANLHVISHLSPDQDHSPVLLLHGLGSCAEDWPLQVPELAKHHNLYAVDLPGHGISPPLEGWPTMSDYASALADWMQVTGLESAHVVGLSLGGLVVLQLAVDHTPLVRSLTIVNAFGRLKVSLWGGLHSAGRVLMLIFGRMEWLGAWVAKALFPDPSQKALRELAAVRIASNPRKAYLQAVGAIARFNLLDRLKRLQIPVLVVAGGRDLIVPLSAKKELAENIPNSKYAYLPESGHVTPIDAGDRFNQLLLDFLAMND